MKPIFFILKRGWSVVLKVATFIVSLGAVSGNNSNGQQ